MHKSDQPSSHKPSRENGNIKHLVSLLPEIYQPIYQHPELSQNISRGCEDRLSHLSAVHNALREKLNRPIRVLDLGCAQGFFSLNLAAIGASVHGIDSLRKNIDLCQALADESAGIPASFETGRVEDIINTLLPDQFDLVLGLSLFHHLIHKHGLSTVRPLLTKLAQTVPIGIYEVALRTEPLYWGPSQPEDPAMMLQDYAFVHELAQLRTHLSEVKRPLYFASNSLWYLNNQLRHFESVKLESHQYAQGVHKDTRRYYFGEGHIVKIFLMNLADMQLPNVKEHQNEVSFLSNPPAGFGAPRLILHGNNPRELWLVRDQLEGRLLIDYFETATPYDHEKIIDDILQQLVTLERAGLYHNDVRSWNVLLSPEQRASLIDYGAISSERNDCVWPSDLLIAFLIFIREVVSHKTVHPDPIRKPWLNIGVLPIRYRNAFLKLLATPKSQWSFSYLQQCIDETNNPHSLDPAILAEGFYTLLCTMENATSIYEETLYHLRNSYKKEQAHGRWLQTVWDDAKVKGQETEARAQGLEVRAQVAEARAQGLEVRAQAAEVRVQAAEARAQALLSSSSWLITAPLRWCGTKIKLLCQHGFRSRAKALAKKMSKPLVRRVFFYISTKPLLHIKCVTVTKKIGLYGPLRTIYRRYTGRDKSQDANPTNNMAVSGQSVAYLTPRARRIYADLKVAIEHCQKESH